MSRRSFGDDDVSRVSNDGHAIRVQQLTVALAALAELKLEAALLVKNLKTHKNDHDNLQNGTEELENDFLLLPTPTHKSLKNLLQL